MIAIRYLPRFLALVALVLGLIGAGTTGMAAAPGTIVADGLANPRGIAVADDGTIYVAEAGLGGTEAFTAPPYPPSTRGMTGRVTRIAPGGARPRSRPTSPPSRSAGRATPSSSALPG